MKRGLYAVIVVGLFTSACVAPVVRVADGQVVPGRFIGERAYAAFLRGALAEAAEPRPDLVGALAAYELAAKADPRDPEVWTRIGRVRCRLNRDDPASREDLARARALDPDYEPAQAAERFCARMRSGEADDARLTDQLDLRPPAPTPPSIDAPGDLGRERRSIEALTLLGGDRVSAWEALAAWGMAHGDVALEVRGMMGVAHRAPARRFSLGQSAVGLAGAGYAVEARGLAGVLMDVPGDRSSGGEGPAPASSALVVRLALDEALLRRDVELVVQRSARAHLGMEIAAGRAWAMGNPALARDLVALTVKADPANTLARLVHDGAAGRAASRLLSGPDASLALPPEVALPFARDVVAAEGVAAGRRVVALAGPILGGDAVLVPLAVDLAIAGVVAEDALPPEGRIELAARCVVAPTEKDVADPALDARHALLGLALLRPTDTATRDKARRMAPAASEDPLVAMAIAKVALAGGDPLAQAPRALLEALAPADPLAAAVLVDLVHHDGPPAALARAKRDLAALAKTPAEQAHAAE